MRRVRAEILSTRTLGAYHSLTLVAPEIAERARPGQFVEIGDAGGPRVHAAAAFLDPPGLAARRLGGHARVRVRPGGPGTTWLAEAKAHEFLDVIGPLGKAFAYPKQLTNCLLVAEGHGAASLYFLAQELRARASASTWSSAPRTQERVFKPIEGKRLSQTIAIVTSDGSLGERGTVVDVLPTWSTRAGTEVIYAAAPATHAARIAAFCAERQIPAQVAVEETDGCGVGLCFTCVVPVIAQGRLGATTTSAPASKGRSSTRRACCGTGGCGRSRACSHAARGIAGGAIVAGVKRDARRRPERAGLATAGDGRVGLRRDRSRAGRARGPAQGRRRREPEHHAAARARGRSTPRIAETPPASCGRPGCRTPASRRSSPTSCRGSHAAARRCSSRSPAASMEEYVRFTSLLQGRPALTAIEIYISRSRRGARRRAVLGLAPGPGRRDRRRRGPDVARAGLREAAPAAARPRSRRHADACAPARTGSRSSTPSAGAGRRPGAACARSSARSRAGSRARRSGRSRSRAVYEVARALPGRADHRRRRRAHRRGRRRVPARGRVGRAGGHGDPDRSGGGRDGGPERGDVPEGEGARPLRPTSAGGSACPRRWRGRASP